MNDGISRERCSFSYVSVAEIASVVLRLGRGSLLAKSDATGRFPSTLMTLEREFVRPSIGPNNFFLLLKSEGGV